MPPIPRILIVDDDQNIVLMLEMRLAQQGYEVFKAFDGRKAIGEARRLNPHLIILDVTLPKMDGFKVLEHLKSDKRTMNIPVIMLTGKSGSEDVEKGIKLYAEKYISKPYDAGYLLQEIEKSLGIFSKSKSAA